MDLGLLLKALLLGIVEGLTEFLPISSTGHLIIAGNLLHFDGESAKVFLIAIQTGAMFAILWHYRERFIHVLTGLGSDRTVQRFVLNLGVAFIPAAVVGLTFGKVIQAHLFAPVPVAAAFVVGAVIILWVEHREHPPIRVDDVDDMTWLDALKVGIAQCFALIPGTSRSGATIIGGMLFGLSRKAATEFSFFLAVPTLIAAGGYDLLKHRDLLRASDLELIAVGTVVSFVSALLCVRWLLHYISRHTFTVFAWYRIVFGVVVLWVGLK